MRKLITIILSVLCVSVGYAQSEPRDMITIDFGTITSGSSYTDDKPIYMFTASDNNTAKRHITLNNGNYDIIIYKLNLSTTKWSGIVMKDSIFNINIKGYNNWGNTNGPLMLYSGRVFISGDTLENGIDQEKVLISTNYSIDENTDKKSIIIESGYFNWGCIQSSVSTLDTLMINNGVIRTKFLAAKTIILNGGSIKLTDNTNIVQSNDGKTVINNDGDTLYCLKVPHDGSYELDVKKSGIPYKKYSFTAHHEGDDNYYIWLPTGEYDIDNGTKTCSINLEAYDLNLENIPLLIPNLKKITREGNGIITLSPDSLFEFTETGYSQYHELSNTNVYYTYSGNKYIFIGNTNAGIDFKPAFPADTIDRKSVV